MGLREFRGLELRVAPPWEVVLGPQLGSMPISTGGPTCSQGSFESLCPELRVSLEVWWFGFWSFRMLEV